MKMISRKRLKDYRIDEQINDKGHVRSAAVYIGADYTLSPPVLASGKRFLFRLSVLAGLLFVGALIPATRTARLMYIILPFTFSALPIFQMAGAAGSLLFAKDIMVRDRAEKISNRLPSCSLFTAILSGSAFSGLCITAAVSADGLITGDFIFGALSLALSLTATIIFIKCRHLKARRVEHDPPLLL